MKSIGYLLIGVGIIYVVIALNMNVSISTPGTYVPDVGFIGGGSVANLDLMARRQNHLIVASLITLVGVLLAIFGPSGEVATASSSRPSPRKEWDVNHDRDLSSDVYRLWLAKHYEIERNDVFDRFVLGDRTFDNLDSALAYAHNLELQNISDRLADEKRRNEQLEVYLENTRLAEAERAARWEEAKPKLAVATVILFAVGIAAYFLMKNTSENSSGSSGPAAITENAASKVVPATPAPIPPVQLGNTLQFSSPSECAATGTLEKVYQKLDKAMEAGANGYTVKLDEFDQPLAVLASKASDDDGAITSESSVRFPPSVEWNGLKLSRIKTSQYEPPETDSSYWRYMTFLEPPDKVMKVLNGLQFQIEMAPAYSDISDPDEVCGGSMQLEAVSGGSSLSCSWGC